MAFAWQNWHFVSCVQLFNEEKVDRYLNKYKLFAGWEVHMAKSCDRGLENAARGRRPKAAFSRPRSQLFTLRTDP